MDSLISRQEAIDDLHGKDPSQVWDTADVEVWVNPLPSAQPEIIRCKECRHSEYDAMYNDRYCHYNGKAEIVGDEHFCGHGMRRPE